MTHVILTKDRRLVQVIGETTIPFISPGLPLELEQALRAMDDMIASVRLFMLIPDPPDKYVEPYGPLDRISPETAKWLEDLRNDQAI